MIADASHPGTGPKHAQYLHFDPENLESSPPKSYSVMGAGSACGCGGTFLISSAPLATKPFADAKPSTFVTMQPLRRLLGIDSREVTLARRGFTAKSPAAKARLERIGENFVAGYHAALIERWPQPLADRLQLIEGEIRGFAFEGAAMALYLLDRLTPWSVSRFERFLAGPGRAHAYMVHVGAGWVLGRLALSPMRAISRMDKMLRWLAIDGYAFHQGYFRPQQAVYGGLVEPSLRGYARRAWDMGLGRVLWFVEGMDVNRISARIKTFERHRQADLWSGVGLACAYAGGADESEVRQLIRLSTPFRPQFAQGVAFAAKARQCAGNMAEHTEMVCKIAWNLSATEAAAITDEELSKARPSNGNPAFESWRQGIQSQAGTSRAMRSQEVELIGV